MAPETGKPLQSPQELLDQTRTGEHNEVTLSPERLRIVGVGIVAVDTPQGPDYPEGSERLREIARERALPCVEWTEPGLTEDRLPEVLYRQGEISGVDLVCAGFSCRILSSDSEFPLFSYKFRYELNRERISASDYEILKPRLVSIVPPQLLSQWDALYGFPSGR